jgi:hypothetical protein
MWGVMGRCFTLHTIHTPHTTHVPSLAMTAIDSSCQCPPSLPTVAHIARGWSHPGMHRGHTWGLRWGGETWSYWSWRRETGVPTPPSQHISDFVPPTFPHLFPHARTPRRTCSQLLGGVVSPHLHNPRLHDRQRS